MSVLQLRPWHRPANWCQRGEIYVQEVAGDDAHVDPAYWVRPTFWVASWDGAEAHDVAGPYERIDEAVAQAERLIAGGAS